EEQHMNVALFVEACKEDSFSRQFVWTDLPAAKTDRQAEARDRAVFAEFAKQNNYGEGIANFNLAREVIGCGLLTQHALIEAVQPRRLRLAAASAEELEEREAERLDAEKLRMMVTPAHQLREEAAQGILDRRQQAKAEEADRAFAAK